MSNNKKKKTKKRMKPETKQKIGLGFASLFNNEACIKIGRNWKWYFPVITGILAIMGEVFAVARAYGCEALPQNGYDLFKVFSGPFAGMLLPVAMRAYRETRSGMLRDIEAGRRCDVDYVAGAAVRAGKDKGVALPVTEAAVSLLHDVENGLAEIAPDTLELLLL